MKNTAIALAIEELKTFRDMVRWGTSQFNAAHLHFGHGYDNAWDEALTLVRHVLHLSPEEDAKVADTNLLLEERKKIAQLFNRRITERKPAAYLTREAWFAGLQFYVDERVIVPRSPIAELIEEGISPWLDETPVHHILDLCTGSACIAIACALAFPHAIVDAVDISKDALEVAQRNVQFHQLEDSVNLIQSDLFKNVPEQKYDLIISNPPYVGAHEMEELPAEFLHEPNLALAAGDQGLDIVIEILKQARNYLSDDGILIIEVGNSAAALEQHFSDFPFLWLDFKRGGHGVFLLTASQLQDLRVC